MGDCIEVMPMKAVRNLLYDEDGRVVGVWYTDTSRGMFYDCFISRMEPERTCSNRHKKFGRDFCCSECGYTASSYVDSKCDPFEFRFCPNCGAMVVDGDG